MCRAMNYFFFWLIFIYMFHSFFYLLFLAESIDRFEELKLQLLGAEPLNRNERQMMNVGPQHINVPIAVQLGRLLGFIRDVITNLYFNILFTNYYNVFICLDALSPNPGSMPVSRFKWQHILTFFIIKKMASPR